MSRARPITLPDGEVKWYNTRLHHERASVEDLQLLASFEDVDFDDLLDASLTQGEVVKRLRKALNQGRIPPEVEMRRRAAQAERQQQPICRKCGKVGESTKHHFVNRWIMKELSNYSDTNISSRSRCCIPLCGECHIDIHDRSEDAESYQNKSIVWMLNPEEKEFARDLIERLRKERPTLFDRLSEGDPDVVYEVRLVHDWLAGAFD